MKEGAPQVTRVIPFSSIHHVRRVGDRDAVVGTEKQFLNGSDGL